MSITGLKEVHIGRKIERIRELRGMKQDALASELGISQQAVSKMEQSPNIDDEKLGKVAVALGVSVEAIRNFSEESVINIISSTLHDNAGSVNYNFNPIEKIVELYERLLESERKRIELLETKLGQK